LKHIIYRHFNKITNLSYIGRTCRDIETRWKEHLKCSKNSNTIFHKSIKEFGAENFISEILEDNIPTNNIAEKEKFWIKFFNSYENGYNMNPGGSGYGLLSEYSKEKYRKTVMKMDNLGNSIAKETYKKRCKTLYSKNKNYLKEIGVKSSKTQKINGKNKGEKNPNFNLKNILIIDNNGKIKKKLKHFELLSLNDERLPSVRMIEWSLTNHFPIYMGNKPRKKFNFDFKGWSACYEDQIYSKLNGTIRNTGKKYCKYFFKNIYKIFDNLNNEKYLIKDIPFNDFCLKNNLNINQFKYSYRQNGKKILKGVFKDWYCIKEKEKYENSKFKKY